MSIKSHPVVPAECLIDGRFVQSTSEETVEVVNPATATTIYKLPVGSALDIDRAVASSRQTFERGVWSDAPPSYRKRTLLKFADLIEQDAANLDALDAEEMGKPISEPFCNARAAAGLVRFCAEAIDKVSGDVCSSDAPTLVLQRLVPRGVVAAITSWNFPTFVTVLKIGPALAAGNCVVLKPSELASRSSIRLGTLALEAGVPPGGLNVVCGLGTTAGRALGLHMDVDMVTFTGSTAVGKQLMQLAGQSNLKVVMVECGGKSPQIVFDDGVDLDAASDAVARSILINQGQLCSVGSRLLVQRSAAETVIERVSARTRAAVIGDPRQASTTFGPLVSRQQCERVGAFIEQALRDGARLVTGGARASLGACYIEPTIFKNVDPSSELAQQEVFGPVLAVIPFDDELDAIRIANNTRYGLSAYVWTADLARGVRLAKAIRSNVTINAAAVIAEGAGFAASTEPARESGVGVEGGLPGFKSYMRRQSVRFNHVALAPRTIVSNN